MHKCKRLLLVLLGIMSCSLSAQTCNTNIQATTPTTQFTDNSDGTITDKKTGLQWKKCLERSSGEAWNSILNTCNSTSNTFSWQQALNKAQTVNSVGFAGKNDWRVPNIKELVSIVEYQCYGPAINLTTFPNTFSGNYWSSSPALNHNDSAWFSDFNTARAATTNKTGGYRLRLVRNADAGVP